MQDNRNTTPPQRGIVYTETIVHSPPEQYAADAPYQLAIIDIEDGGRLTVRILGKPPGERASVGDEVVFAEERNGVSYFRRATAFAASEATQTPRPLV